MQYDGGIFCNGEVKAAVEKVCLKLREVLCHEFEMNCSAGFNNHEPRARIIQALCVLTRMHLRRICGAGLIPDHYNKQSSYEERTR